VNVLLELGHSAIKLIGKNRDDVGIEPARPRIAQLGESR